MSERVEEARGRALPPVAVALLIGATGWFLLQELAPLLRPLLLAVFLCYVIVPGYHLLRDRVHGPVAFLTVAGGTTLVIYIVGLILQDNIIALQEELPRLTARAKLIFGEVRTHVGEVLPWLTPSPEEAAQVDAQRATRLQAAAALVLSRVANVFFEAVLVGIFLLFLLLEVPRLPSRLRGAFSPERGEEISAVVRKINESIASYLRVKVKASLILALPITFILWVFGINFPVLWGLLNFFGNFIPYLGSVVGFSVPVIFLFLDIDPDWRPFVAAGLILAVHLLMAYVIEPTMTGKAVGLSPLVILISLSFWGLCWGLIGMFLAVPLTVIVKIILANIPYTVPIAKLLGDD